MDRIRRLKIVRVVLLLLLVGTFISLFLPFLIGLYVDFPCSVRYDAEKGCVPWGLSSDDEGGAIPRIDTYLSAYSVWHMGAGCSHKASFEDEFLVETGVLDLHLERIGEDVMVNGKLIQKGENFSYTNVFSLYPWSIAEVEFSNLGVVRGCDAPSGTERLVLSGEKGTRFSFTKGGIIFSVLAVLLVFITLHLKNLEGKRWAPAQIFEFNRAKTIIFIVLSVITPLVFFAVRNMYERDRSQIWTSLYLAIPFPLDIGLMVLLQLMTFVLALAGTVVWIVTQNLAISQPVRYICVFVAEALYLLVLSNVVYDIYNFSRYFCRHRNAA